MEYCTSLDKLHAYSELVNAAARGLPKSVKRVDPIESDDVQMGGLDDLARRNLTKAAVVLKEVSP